MELYSRPVLDFMYGLLLITSTVQSQAFAQGRYCGASDWDALRGRQLIDNFARGQAEYQQARLEERRRVPVYNALLNNAVIEFHKHISKDAHYLATNCHICRKYLKEIKSSSKKLQSAME